MSVDDETPQSEPDYAALVAQIVSAYVSHNQVAMEKLPDLIAIVATAITGQSSPSSSKDAPGKPAVPIKKSFGDDFIICLEDGKRMKMLKRYLSTHYNLSPQEYRAKWGLPADYPMVAPAYARQRAAFAKQIGLGKKA